MAPNRPHAEIFAWAQGEAAVLPGRVGIALRLAQLEAELTHRRLPPGDPRVPRLIAALFPPGALGPPPLTGPRSSQEYRTARKHATEATEALPARRARLRQRLRRIALVLIAVLLSLLPASSMPPSMNAPPTDPATTIAPLPQPGGVWKRTDIIVLLTNWDYYKHAAAIVVAGTALWLFLSRRRQRLIRERNPDLGPVVALSVRLARRRLFGGPAFAGALRAFKQRHRAASSEIDVAKTLRATISQGGFPTIVFGERRIAPAFLLMNERQSPDDHLPELGKALGAAMANAQIAVRQFEYFGAPYRLGTSTPAGNAVWQPLDMVLAHNPGARAVLIGEAFDLEGDLEGDRGRDLAADLARYHSPVLLNPRGDEHWDAPERGAARLGIGRAFLGDLSAETIAEALALPHAGSNRCAEEAADLPEFLSGMTDLVLADSQPQSLDSEALIANLAEEWLTPTEMAWLRTIALFPAAHIGFTWFSGIALAGHDSLDPASVLRLFRLPWLRAGHMPDWLRQELVCGFTPEQFADAKAIIAAFFAPATAKASSARDILKARAAAQTARGKRLFARQLGASNLPALRDSLLQAAIKCDNPSEVEIKTQHDNLKRWWQRPDIAAAAAVALSLTLQSLIDSRLTENYRTEFKWAPDPVSARPNAPAAGPSTPAPSAAAPDPTTNPGPERADRTVYIQFANRRDLGPALALIGELGSLNFEGGPAIFPGIEYRPNSPSRTEVRCFTDTACRNAATLIDALDRNGVIATLRDGRRGRFAGARALELWLADKDLPDMLEQADNEASVDSAAGAEGAPTISPSIPSVSEIPSFSCQGADVNQPETEYCTCPTGTEPAMSAGSQDMMECRPSARSDTREEIVQAQRQLRQLGYYEGAIDGIMAAQTRSAIRRFQKGIKLPPTGMLDPQTASALGFFPREATVN